MACAIHCAMLPILLSIAPSLAMVQWFADPIIHQAVTVMCAVLVGWSLIPSVAVHGDKRPLKIAMMGLALLFLAAFVLPDRCCISPQETPTEAPQIRLVSSSSSTIPMQAGFVSTNFGGRLLSGQQLSDWFGYSVANWIIDLNRFLTPAGGVMLIAAHLWNFARRSRCC